MSSLTGNKTWGEIREDFLNLCRGSTSAQTEGWSHLTQGYREVFQQAEIPEVFEAEDNETVAIESGTIYNDFILADRATIYHLDSVYNVTDQRELEPEPSGMPGRDRYLRVTDGDTRGKPPEGVVRWFCRYGSRIYLRNTPTEAVVLTLRYRKQAPILSSGDATGAPVTPVHLDWAISFYAAANFYRAHPDLNQPIGEGQPKPSMEYQAEGDRLLMMPKHIRGEEMKMSQHRQRLMGYRFGPRH